MTQVFYNATVYAGAGGFAEAFAVDNGRFIAVGNEKDVLAAYPEAERRDCRNAFICAGFNDSHMHALGYGALLSGVDLAERSGALADMLAALRDAAARMVSGDWLIARGWNHDRFADEKRFPTKEDLDTVSRTIPIAATRVCGHICVCNSRALREAGVTRETKDPEGGVIDRDEWGEPTGVFRENAIDLIARSRPVPSLPHVKHMLKKAVRRLNERGVTSIQTDDFSTIPGLYFETVLRAYAELESEGALTVKVNEQANLQDDESLERFYAADLRTGAGSGRVRIGPVKLLADGSLGARTAYLSQPYSDKPDTRGIAVYTQPKLDLLIRRAHENGMQIAVHCIGDAALDMTLNAIDRAQERCPRANARHGIVHCQITRPEQLEQMRRLRLHAYIQPVFLDYDTEIVTPRSGMTLAASSYAFHTLYRDCEASSGSDCPVETPEPLRGIQCAVTRAPINAPHACYRPEEALTVAEAIDSYTINGARASFEEDRKGLIRTGYAADFAVLEADPFATYPARIADIRVMETWLDGKMVYNGTNKEE